MPRFSQKSKDNLASCHQDLQDVFNEVIRYKDCSVLCGHRNRHDQNHLYSVGKSHAQYPQGKHNFMPSEAVDAVPYPIKWDDANSFYEFAGFVMGVAAKMGIKIKWGGHFKGFFDGPHYEKSELKK